MLKKSKSPVQHFKSPNKIINIIISLWLNITIYLENHDCLNKLYILNMLWLFSDPPKALPIKKVNRKRLQTLIKPYDLEIKYVTDPWRTSWVQTIGQCVCCR